MEHTTGHNLVVKFWKFLGAWIIRILGILAGIEVIKVAEKFVKTMQRG
jgi:hypothetical protein